MVDPRIVEYIKANRRHYTDQAIRQRLLDAGYSASDIDATWAAVDIPDPDRTIGPRFWRYFWIWVLVTYTLGFLLVALPSGMLGGFGMLAAFIFAALLGVALLISWAIVAAVQPARLSAPVALAIGGIVPFLFLFLVAGTCYALVGGLGSSVGPAGPPPVNGVMDLEIDPPLDFSGSGSASCQSHGEGVAGYSIHSEELGVIGGRTVTVSVDVFEAGPAPEPGALPQPVPGQPSVFVNLNPTSPDDAPGGFAPGPATELELDATPDGLSGTVQFERLESMAFEGPESDTELISGRITWNCE